MKTTRKLTITVKTGHQTSHGYLPSGTWTYWIEDGFLNFVGDSVFSWQAREEDGSDLIWLMTNTIYHLK